MRRFWSISARLLAAQCILAAGVGVSAAADEVVLEDNALKVAFDSHSGALTRLEDKTSHWTIERRPELGVSFRLFAPLPDRRWNPVLGQKQAASQVTKFSDHELKLQWKNLASETGGVLPITLTAMVALTNGALTFDLALQNDSPLTVETVDYPYFGDFNAPARSSSLEACIRRGGKPGNLQTDELYPHFRNEHGYWGDFFPLKTLEAQQSPFCLIQSPGEGVCVGVDAARLPYRLQYTFEQHPGVVSSIDSSVPQADTIAGTPVHLEVRTCHFVFAGPHSATNLVPVVIQCYQGTSKEGIDLYNQRRSSLAH